MASTDGADLAKIRSEVEATQRDISLASTRDDALDLALNAVELAMRALKLSKDKHSRGVMSAKVQSLLEEAERIKFSDDWKPRETLLTNPEAKLDSDYGAVDISKIKKLREPVSTRMLTKAEEILLLKASKLNGFKFPPWKNPPLDSDFELHHGEQLFIDQPDLRISETQSKVFDGWKRPSDALPPPAWSTSQGGGGGLGPTMSSGTGIDLVQDAATDCSVVASLCAGTARGERGHAKLLSSIIFPYDSARQQPRMSENGRYVVRLNFNGTYRRVDIDDRLPVSKTLRVIHVVDRRAPGLLWPALLEKAYLKVRGSYDFPGSNSGTDLWILSGWIPEQVFLQSDDTVLSQVWKRICGAHQYGDVLVTMGTGKMSGRAEKETGLAGQHDYAVLDLREVSGQKLMLVKNPWCQGGSWKGSRPRAKEHMEARFGASCDDLMSFDEEDAVPSSRDLLNQENQLSPGTFWMDLNSVVQHFESIYLNWNPGLFSHRQDTHFSWNLETQAEPYRGKYRSFRGYPQFSISTDTGGTLWVLLCRHFRDAPAEPGSGSAQISSQDTQLSGYISLYAFDHGGSRVILSDEAMVRGPYVDSPQTLLKLENLSPGKPYTVVAAEQDLVATTHTFTISTFSTSRITLEDAKDKYAYHETISATWTHETAGGNASSPLYSCNPQFSLTLKHSTSLALIVETPNEHLNVHVKLVHGRGQRLQTLRSRDIVFDSKDYRRGCALAEYQRLDAGTYTIICSNFEAGQTGSFTLRVDSTLPSELRQLPREDAGRVRVKLAKAAFHGQQYKIAAPLLPRRMSKMKLNATHTNQGAAMADTQRRERSMIRVSVEIGRGPERHILVASNNGEYSDSIAGVRTEEIDLSPLMAVDKHVFLVVERMFSPRDLPEEWVQVELFTETPDALGVGVWRNWDD